MDKIKGTSNIKVSVIMPVYNHERYIEQAIQSVLMQKVNFEYELLIGEDCSTDKSLELIKKYENRKEVKLFARKKNMNQEKIRNGVDLELRAKGEYMIILEGDDYWTDSCKLQKQVDFLDNHPDYIACGHRFQVVDEKGKTYYDQDFECQFFQNNDYNKNVFENGYMLSHINTILFRNIFPNLGEEIKIFTDYRVVGNDYLLTALLVLKGKMYCMPNIMSCYRKVIRKSSSSYSAEMEKNNQRDEQYKDIVNAEKFFNKKYIIDFSKRKKSIFASAVFKWYRDKNKKNWTVIGKIICYSQHSLRYTVYLIYLLFARICLNVIGRRNVRVKF